MSDWNGIKQEVEKSGNVLTFTMDKLRDAAGYGKLGSGVCWEISKTLAGMGLGHVPNQLPQNQWEQVRLYKRGTSVGEIIELVLSPGQQNDTVLREKFGQAPVDHSAIIAKIRDLVAE